MKFKKKIENIEGSDGKKQRTLSSLRDKMSHMEIILKDIPQEEGSSSWLTVLPITIQCLSIFSPNAEEYRPEKHWMRTLFTQC